MEHRLRSLTLLLLMALTSMVSAQTCNRTQCDSTLNCVGFGNEICYNSTSTAYYTGSVCYVTTPCSANKAADGDLTLTLSGASPKTIFDFNLVIQNAIMNEYNKFCRAGNNYQLCCPGAGDWPSRVNGTNVTAMTNATTEVPIVSVSGSAVSTVMSIRLTPNTYSQLCNATVKATTSTSTTTTTTTASTTMSSSSSTSSSTSSSSSSSSSSTSSTASTSAGTGGAAAAAGTASTTSTIAGSSNSSASTPTSTASTPTSTASTPSSTVSTSTTTTRTAAVAVTSSATNSMMTSPVPAASNATANRSARRRRDLSAAEERGYEDESAILSRERRDVPASTLPLTVVTAISSGINITGVVQAALSQNNITVSITVSVVGSSAASDTTTSATVTVAKKSAGPSSANAWPPLLLIAACYRLL